MALWFTQTYVLAAQNIIHSHLFSNIPIDLHVVLNNSLVCLEVNPYRYVDIYVDKDPSLVSYDRFVLLSSVTMHEIDLLLA